MEVIKRKRVAARQANLSPSDTVSLLANTVWGFDLNPLAVQAARTNFLIAIADLLQSTPGQQIEIPVLLADAVYSPAPPPGADSDIVEYQIGSQVADLKVLLPSALAFDRARLDRVFETMGECVANGLAFASCGQRLLTSAGVTKAELVEWEPPLRSTYDQVLALHKKSWNGIWFRIVRNFFWSATAGQFDLIVGNPPWVRWSKLPSEYRERAKPTCEQWPAAGLVDAILS
jgi:hypothetical protein